MFERLFIDFFPIFLYDIIYIFNADNVEAFLMTLNELAPGKSAVIRRVGGEGELRLRFLDMGLIPRTVVTLQKVAPMGDPIEIMVRGYELTLRVSEAQWIEVEPV